MARLKTVLGTFVAMVLVFMTAAGALAAPAADPADTPGPSESASAPSEGPGDGDIVLDGGIFPAEDSGLWLEQAENGLVFVRGLVARAAKEAVRAEEFLGMFVMPDGVSGEVRRKEYVLNPGEIVATGDIVAFSRGGEEVSRATVVVSGDVIGTGIISLAQLVRLAGVFSGSGSPLKGAYLAAGDFNANGEIGLGDLVQEAELLKLSMADA